MSKFKLLGFLFACSLLLPSWAAAQAPTITTQPAARVIAPGANVTFTVAATGAGTLTYQWKKDGVDLANAAGHLAGVTAATLTITAATADDAGSYTVDVTNGPDTTTSSPAELALSSPPVAGAATDITTSGFTVSWAAVDGATGYQIDVARSRTFGTSPNTYATGYQATDVGNTLSAAITGLLENTTYFFRVRPYNAVGVGDSSTNSNLVIVRTSASAPSAPTGVAILDETFPAASGTYGSDTIVPPQPTLNDSLSRDSNNYFVPTSSQGVWFTGGTPNSSYVQNTMIYLASGNRGYFTYFEPSSSVASLAIGETLSVTVRLKFTDGTLNSNAANFRIALLNSNGAGGTVNVPNSTTAQNPARITAQNFSLTNDVHARGYSGYIVETNASSTAPAADSIAFWERLQATWPNDSSTAPSDATKGSSQWVGPSAPSTLESLSASVPTFVPIGAAGGGAVGAITNDGRDYLINLSVKRVSDTQVDLSYTATAGGAIVQSHSASQTSGSLVTSFDSFLVFSQTGVVPTVLGLTVAKLPAVPSITTQPADQVAVTGGGATFSVAADSTDPLSYQWQKRPSGGSFVDIDGATSATLTLSNLQSSDAADYQVIVSNSGGSVTSDIATLTVGPAPDAPVGSPASDLSSTGFTAGWAAVSGAIDYRLDVSTSNTFDSFVSGYEDLDAGTALSWGISGLQPSTTYYFRVRAVNVYGTGAASSPVQVDTPAALDTQVILDETFPNATAAYTTAPTVNDSLSLDANNFPAPTATQAAWASFGTNKIAYTQNTSLGLSAGASRGLIAYFSPSTAPVSLVPGETLTAKVTFSYAGGTVSDAAGNLRIALLNSGGNGTASNVGGTARFPAGASNSLVSLSQSRGYSGYIADVWASSSARTNTLSFWKRTAAADAGSGSTQIVGPTSGDIPSALPGAASTFSQVGANGGGSVGTILNDGTVYTAFVSVSYVSATQVDLTCTIMQGDTTVVTYTASQDSGDLVTGFDSLMFFSTFGAAPTIRGLEISRKLVAPTIVTPPEAKTTTVGETVALTIGINGSSPLTYQWKKDGVVLADETGHVSGATTASLTLTGVQLTDQAAYSIVVSNAVGSVTSDPVTLTVSAAPQPPVIATQPEAATAAYGGSASFTVAASGTPPFTYEWYKNDVAIDGATSATLSLSNVTTADAASYKVVVTNVAGTAVSEPVALTVTPAIVTQPKAQTAFSGGVVNFTVVATGAGPFTYQWKLSGGSLLDAPDHISGATTASLTLTNVAASDVGDYTVVVTDAGGSITSSAAHLSLDTSVTVAQPTLPTIRAVTYNILDYYAAPAPVPAGLLAPAAAPSADYTAAIQAAIDAAFAAGGGIVEVPAAATPYRSGPLTLRSGINLQIDSGATLQALPYGTYPDGGTNFITIPSGTTDVALTGGGTIEGDGTAWWTAYDNDSSVARPRLVQFNGATRVLVSGVTLQNSPQFHVAFSGANDSVTITGVTINAPSTSPNTDGIDPSGSNFLIQNCAIAVGDDNIAVKAGSTPASKITVAYCTFGTGHGLSVGGQTNAGLDGLTVTNCTFNGTTSGLRLKADATQGGLVQNLAYSNLTMTNVAYPIVFYSYYNEIGTPGTTGGSAVTPGTVNTRNAAALGGTAIPQWRKISISSLTATGATGYSIIWGLPLTEGLISDVTLTDVSITGGAGFKIYNAKNVQFTGSNNVGTLTTANAAIITGQPQSIAPGSTVNAGGTATFTVTAAATSGTNGTAPSYQWSHNGVALVEGSQPDGSTMTGTNTSQLTITQLRGANAGSYTCTVSNKLDGYASATGSFAVDSLPVSLTSASANLTVNYSSDPNVDNSPTIPRVTTALTDQGVTPGTTVHFTAGFASDYPITAYQWLKDGVLLADGGNISGTTTAALTITGAQVADAGVYTAVAWDEAGSVSTAATLAIGLPPSITQQPAGPAAAVLEGVDVSFTVVASGYDPKTYQWMHDGQPLTDDGSHVTGATSDTLQLSGVVADDAGSYTVEVSNAIGSVTSDAAVLSVHTAPGKPVANAATNITTGRFLASWNAVDAATSYRLDVSTRGDFASYVSGYQDLDVGAGLSRYVNALSPGTTYYYRVRAVNDLGASPSSDVIAVTTLPLQLAPAITSVNHTTFTLGLACTFTVTASGSPAPTFSATGLPSWLTLDAATGVLSGTPPEGTAGASIPLVLTAANGVAPAASQSFTLEVASAPSASTPMTVTTIAGAAGVRGNADGTGAFARFNHPSGITVDPAGNVDVADTDNFTIRQIDSTYAVTRIAGIAGRSGSDTGEATSATFASPSAIVASDDGVLYIADTLNDTIISLSGGNAGRFAGQTGVAGTADGDASATSTFSGPQGLAWWRGIIPGGSSTRTFLYVADTANDTIRRIETILTTTTGADGKPTTTASYTVTTFAGLAGEAGSADGSGTAARFNGPTALAADRAGNVYVADTDNNTIRVISPLGAVRTLAGLAGSSGAADGTGSAARFNHPAALIADDSFNVYVLDSDNHTVRKITPAGKVTTVAGLAGKPGSADGAGVEARFRNPTGIARSDDGRFYISDTNNHTIRLGLFPNAPTITSQPKNITLTAGASALFGVTAAGVPEPTYQWLFNGKEISGATSATLSISGVQASDAGKYSVVVTNDSGSVTSNEAVLTVTAPTSPGGVTGGGGGGGAPGYGFLSALTLLAAARWFTRRRAAQTLGSLN